MGVRDNHYQSMIFQLSNYWLSNFLFVDLILLGLLLTPRLTKSRLANSVLLVLLGLSFIGYSFIKLSASKPHLFASSPAPLELKNNDFFRTFYFLEHRNGELTFFWKEHMFKGSKQRFFETESSIPTDGLTLATKIDGTWNYLTTYLSSTEPNILEIDKSNFRLDSDGTVKKAYSKYLLTELGNYSSNLLSLLFLLAFISIIKKVSNRPLD